MADLTQKEADVNAEIGVGVDAGNRPSQLPNGYRDYIAASNLTTPSNSFDELGRYKTEMDRLYKAYEASIDKKLSSQPLTYRESEELKKERILIEHEYDSLSRRVLAAMHQGRSGDAACIAIAQDLNREMSDVTKALSADPSTRRNLVSKIAKSWSINPPQKVAPGSQHDLSALELLDLAESTAELQVRSYGLRLASLMEKYKDFRGPENLASDVSDTSKEGRELETSRFVKRIQGCEKALYEALRSLEEAKEEKVAYDRLIKDPGKLLDAQAAYDRRLDSLKTVFTRLGSLSTTHRPDVYGNAVNDDIEDSINTQNNAQLGMNICALVRDGAIAVGVTILTCGGASEITGPLMIGRVGALFVNAAAGATFGIGMHTVCTGTTQGISVAMGKDPIQAILDSKQEMNEKSVDVLKTVAYALAGQGITNKLGLLLSKGGDLALMPSRVRLIAAAGGGAGTGLLQTCDQLADAYQRGDKEEVSKILSGEGLINVAFGGLNAMIGVQNNKAGTILAKALSSPAGRGLQISMLGLAQEEVVNRKVTPEGALNNILNGFQEFIVGKTSTHLDPKRAELYARMEFASNQGGSDIISSALHEPRGSSRKEMHQFEAELNQVKNVLSDEKTLKDFQELSNQPSKETRKVLESVLSGAHGTITAEQAKQTISILADHPRLSTTVSRDIVVALAQATNSVEAGKLATRLTVDKSLRSGLQRALGDTPSTKKMNFVIGELTNPEYGVALQDLFRSTNPTLAALGHLAGGRKGPELAKQAQGILHLLEDPTIRSLVKDRFPGSGPEITASHIENAKLLIDILSKDGAIEKLRSLNSSTVTTPSGKTLNLRSNEELIVNPGEEPRIRIRGTNDTGITVRDWEYFERQHASWEKPVLDPATNSYGVSTISGSGAPITVSLEMWKRQSEIRESGTFELIQNKNLTLGTKGDYNVSGARIEPQHVTVRSFIDPVTKNDRVEIINGDHSAKTSIARCQSTDRNKFEFTKLNPNQREVLRIGDRIRIGDTVFQVEANRLQRITSNAPFFPNGARDLKFAQRGIGDCYLLASLHALSAKPEASSFLENLITEGPNQTCTVHFYLGGKPVDVTVSRDEVLRFRKDIYERSQNLPQGYDREAEGVHGGNNRGTEWGLRVLETAYDKFRSQYNLQIPKEGDFHVEAGFMGDTLEHLTGRRSIVIGDRINPLADYLRTNGQDVKAKFRELGGMSKGTIFTAATISNIGDSTLSDEVIICKDPELYANHAYSVTINESGVTLVNPHNTKGSIYMSVEDFCRYFRCIEGVSVQK